MKKVVAVLLVLAMVFGFAACGDSKEEAKDDVLKVGFIYIGSAKDGGFSEAQDNGREKMVEHFDGKVETVVKEEVSDTDAQATKDAALSLMDEGCKVIVGCSFGYMDAMEELAEEYPETYFLHFSGNKKNDTNFDNYFGAMEEPRYLAGMAAGEMTKTNKIGYVAAFPYTEVQIGINAFALGVQKVNPEAEVKVVYINTWYDPEKEKSAAEALLDQGCDVLEQHCDTTGPITAAKDAGKYAIGYNLDKSADFPETVLTTPIWHHEVYYNQAIQDILDGKFKPQSYYGYMKDGYVDIADLNEAIPEDARNDIEAVRDQMKKGEFYPFTGEIKYANGKVLCKKDQTLTREEVWKINDVIEGVSATEQK